MAESEVAAFRRQQALQEEAAELGLRGLAIVASHESITARLEIGAERILKLFQEGKQEEAIVLMSTPDWCQNDEEESNTTCTDATANETNVANKE